jgi:hypothetical protein
MLTHRSLSLPMIPMIAGECWLFWRLGAGAERLCAAIGHVEKKATRATRQAGILRGGHFADAEFGTAGVACLERADRRELRDRVAPALMLDATFLFLQDGLIMLDLICQRDPACHHRHQGGDTPGRNLPGVPEPQALDDMRPAFLRSDGRKSTSGSRLWSDKIASRDDVHGPTLRYSTQLPLIGRAGSPKVQLGTNNFSRGRKSLP